MKNKFEIGDLITSLRFLGLGIITDKSDRAIACESRWYYYIHFYDGDAYWLSEDELVLEVKANK